MTFRDDSYYVLPSSVRGQYDGALPDIWRAVAENLSLAYNISNLMETPSDSTVQSLLKLLRYTNEDRADVVMQTIPASIAKFDDPDPDPNYTLTPPFMVKGVRAAMLEVRNEFDITFKHRVVDNYVMIVFFFMFLGYSLTLTAISSFLQKRLPNVERDFSFL